MAAKPIRVFAPGSEVKVGRFPDQFDGTVTAVAIHAGGFVRYQVAWWDDRDRIEEWLEDFEVEGKRDQQVEFSRN